MKVLLCCALAISLSIYQPIFAQEQNSFPPGLHGPEKVPSLQDLHKLQEAKTSTLSPPSAMAKPAGAASPAVMQEAGTTAELNELLPAQSSAKALTEINASKRVKVNEDFQLTLHGLVWTYIPALSQYQLEPKLERSLGDQQTQFRFKFRKSGRYLLSFSRQFPSTGKLEYYTLEVIAEDPKNTDPAPKIETYQAAAIPEKSLSQNMLSSSLPSSRSLSLRVTSQVLQDLRNQLASGDIEGAYKTLNSWAPNERGDIFDEAAKVFLAHGRPDYAYNMWQRNITMTGDLGESAKRGSLESAMAAQNPEWFQKSLRPFLNMVKNDARSDDAVKYQEVFQKVYSYLGSVDDQARKPMPAVQSAQAAGGDAANSKAPLADVANADIFDFYQMYIQNFRDKNVPRIIYEMALILEKPGKMQDLQQAGTLYRSLQSDYPVDRYSELASQRLHYLNRQFFVVR